MTTEMISCAIRTCARKDVCEQPLRRNVKRFRGGLVFKARRLLYHLTLGLRVLQKKMKNPCKKDVTSQQSATDRFGSESARIQSYVPINCLHRAPCMIDSTSGEVTRGDNMILSSADTGSFTTELNVVYQDKS